MSTNQNLVQHMRELIDCIKAADVAYYRDDNPTMTDREYDLLVDELKELETTTGLILSGSPTQTVSGEILKELTPVRHTTQTHRRHTSFQRCNPNWTKPKSGSESHRSGNIVFH